MTRHRSHRHPPITGPVPQSTLEHHMRSTTRYRAAATVAVLAGAALAGCGGGDDGETLQVYSGRHYGIETAFEQYEDETGVKLEFQTGNDGELRERLAAEGEDT